MPGANIPVSNPGIQIRVTADGPTRVLKIMNSSVSIQPECTPSRNTGRLNYECSFCIDVGISIVDWKPQELVYFSLTGLSLYRHFSRGEDIIQFAIRNVAADCCLWITQYPILFHVVKGNRKDAVTVRWSRDINDDLGKDITLLRYANVELGKLVFKVDGVLANLLVKMSNKAKMLEAKEETSSIAAGAISKSSNQVTLGHSSQIDTAANAAKLQPQGCTTTCEHATLAEPVKSEILYSPMHKYYIEKLNISVIRAEVSYCGASPLPTWLNPAFMFETLPIRFPSYSSSYMYGSVNEHMEGIKRHYNMWRLLFGLSLRPMFIARACIFTTKQSISVIYSKASRTIGSFSERMRPCLEFQDSKTLVKVKPTTDARTRAPRLFAKLDNSDVLVEYVEGENSGRALLSRVRMGRHLFEGYVSHGDLQGVGDYDLLSYDDDFLYILTQERILILKRSNNMDAPTVFWEVELQSIALVERVDLSLQLFYMDPSSFGLSMLSSKLVFFNNVSTAIIALKFIQSINNRLRDTQSS